MALKLHLLALSVGLLMTCSVLVASNSTITDSPVVMSTEKGAGEEKKTSTVNQKVFESPGNTSNKTPTVPTTTKLSEIKDMKHTDSGSDTEDGTVTNILTKTSSSPPISVNGSQPPTEIIESAVPGSNVENISKISFTTPNNSEAEAKHDIPKTTSSSPHTDLNHKTEKVMTTETPKSSLKQITDGASKVVLATSSAVPDKQATDTDSDHTTLPSDTESVKSTTRNKDLVSSFPEADPHDTDSDSLKTGVHPPTNPDYPKMSGTNDFHTNEKDIPSSGHFFAYFLTAVVICISGYVIFHNKQKILAFIIEGRDAASGGRKRTNNGVKYSQLQSNVEEVIPSLDKATSVKNFVY